MEQNEVLTALRAAFPEAVLAASGFPDEPVIMIRPQDLVPVMAFLKEAPRGYAMLLDLTCVDWPDRAERFEMVYHVFSLASSKRIRVKASLPADAPVIASLTSLWKNADWLEREAFDMFGVGFEGHPELRRLFMYDGFEGHPLRKDYPLRKRQPRIPMRSTP